MCLLVPCSFSCGLPSVSLCLSALFPLGFLLCAPPLHYHTWPPPSSPSSPVPRWLSVSVCSVCVFPLLPVWSLYVFCMVLSALSVPALAWSCLWNVFLDFEFCFCLWFELCYLVCTLSSFGCNFASCPRFVCFWFLYSPLKIKLAFCFSLDLASCLTAFGSTSVILSISLKPKPDRIRTQKLWLIIAELCGLRSCLVADVGKRVNRITAAWLAPRHSAQVPISVLTLITQDALHPNPARTLSCPWVTETGTPHRTLSHFSPPSVAGAFWETHSILYT